MADEPSTHYEPRGHGEELVDAVITAPLTRSGFWRSAFSVSGLVCWSFLRWSFDGWHVGDGSGLV